MILYCMGAYDFMLMKQLIYATVVLESVFIFSLLKIQGESY